ncbi:MAG: hypothetical protein FJ291_03030 [Planctomycetes bacterium]|nr:hypothetical protein [Planctomycetota bacterium]
MRFGSAVRRAILGLAVGAIAAAVCRGSGGPDEPDPCREKAKAGFSWWDAEELIVDGPAEWGDIHFYFDENWFFFEVVAAGVYTVETWPGSLDDSFMTLFDEDLRFIDDDDNRGTGLMSKITRTLRPGTYYVLVQPYGWWDDGDYTISVRSTAPVLSRFAINNGAIVTAARPVTLNHASAGVAAEFMASESPTFAGAAWLPYVPTPPFTLSAGNDTKTVYLKVRDANLRESNTVWDRIYLDEPIPVELIVNGPPRSGDIWPPGNEDWFFFNAAAPGTYTIETWADTLNDNTAWLFQADQTTLIATDDASGERGRMARIVQALAPGTYFVRVRATKWSKTGTYLIRVTTGTPQVAILNPHGDPTANTWLEVGNSEVVFTSRTPGVLEVFCSFAVNAPGVADLANKVRAAISPVGASPLEWRAKKGLSPWLGSAAGLPPGAHGTTGKAVLNTKTGRYEVSARFTGLPANNADFGLKSVWAQIVDGATVIATAQQPIEVFHHRWAANNPGVGRDRGPNWFYYWKTGNVCGTTTGWEYMWGWGYGSYFPGDDHVHVRDLAPTENSGPETYTNDLGGTVVVTGQGIGPFCAAETIAHEFQHKWFYDNWDAAIAAAEADGENDGDDYDDPDDDGIPNLFEPAFLGIATDANDPDTYNMGGRYATYGDEELRARKKELDTGLTVTKANDWTYPGSNSYPRYQGD